jgi:hypothetical protein
LEELAVAQGCDSFEWIKTLEGLVMGVQCFGGELPFFFISGKHCVLILSALLVDDEELSFLLVYKWLSKDRQLI